ncbi:alpha/beta fold hydrolase [Mesorhizobium escarrei]|uniref:AB hydrolase-1 domain-containing protein n=1 Tax=Mesorhizobium escarrei TaxID=666018 RepID=A0ABM9DJW1_9HYPH|nr:alpha/beta hydrolase [Mesorhizobium escarrei]CAH2396660.1 AB hydrolase-1 domain-containing protein [Mesorhizobium escarrei]
MGDLRFATVRLATGPQIHYAEQGNADGDPILFLHGWPDSWFSFSSILPLLSHRVHAFVLDQRGFGDSEALDAGYGIDEFAADAVAFLDAVSIERATIVGHSFGSFVARHVAITNPERVARLVLIGTGVSAATPVTREVQATLMELPDPVPVEFARDFQASTAHVPLPESFFERIVAESLKLAAWRWRSVLDGLLAYDDTEQLSRIVTPTLLIWGERDVLFSRNDQDRLVTAIRGSKLLSYPETGHCPNWERPQRVAADLEAFIDQS